MTDYSDCIISNFKANGTTCNKSINLCWDTKPRLQYISFRSVTHYLNCTEHYLLLITNHWQKVTREKANTTTEQQTRHSGIVEPCFIVVIHFSYVTVFLHSLPMVGQGENWTHLIAWHRNELEKCCKKKAPNENHIFTITLLP